jgi:hypothetical protein
MQNGEINHLKAALMLQKRVIRQLLLAHDEGLKQNGKGEVQHKSGSKNMKEGLLTL